MMQSEQINELAGALAKAQGAMANATLNKVNPHFKSKYADLSSVLDAIRTPLSTAGLSVVQTMQTNEHGLLVLRTMLMHSSGQYISTEYPLPSTQRAHEMGSALTYARRYSLAALICNSADEDDDGNAAMTTKPNGSQANSVHLNADQIKTIEILVEETGADLKRFCDYMKVASIADISAKQYQRAVDALNAKRDQAA